MSIEGPPIRANLSEEVGEALREVLAKGKDDAKIVVTLSRDTDRLDERVGELNKELKESQANNVAQAALRERENAVQLREVTIQVQDAKLEAAKDAKDDLFDLVWTIFANPTVRRETLRSINHPSDYQKSKSESTSETIKEE